MLELLNFFDGEAASGAAAGAGTGTGAGGWITWVILAVLIVGMVLVMIIPQRKQKKRAEEMMSKLTVGAVVTTIGGIVGEVVDIDEKHIWLLTGIGENKTTMQFLRQAIHAVMPAPGTPEYEAEQKAAEQKADEVDEVK
ncbi:MAG: preprotein translocase subunit YajC [Clostridiales bacterium]|nr:preprotein translocase subunit YajC [Clostridiales bacterium]